LANLYWLPAAAPALVLIPTGAVPVEVVGVTDGDTITALVAGRQIKVRLNGINAPEKSGLSGMPQNTRGRF
jgi:endonuclease YncB( thermonuclease family)